MTFSTMVASSTITLKRTTNTNTQITNESQSDQYLRHIDDKLPELGVISSLLLQPIGNGFAQGFHSEGTNLQKREHHTDANKAI